LGSSNLLYAAAGKKCIESHSGRGGSTNSREGALGCYFIPDHISYGKRNIFVCYWVFV